MKRLVLLGGGHAHVKVLADFGERPLPGWEIHLVTPYRRQIYSGMLPGWIAGHYPLDACTIPLDALAARAGVAFHESAGIGLDPMRNALWLADGSTLHFDHLSINTGPVAAINQLPGNEELALPIRPIERFVASWPVVIDRMLSRCARFDLVILGAGAAGVELAFAVQHRTMTDGWSHLRIALVGPDPLPLDGAPEALRRQIATLLARRGIAWHGERRAVEIQPDRIVFETAEPLNFDACLVVTGAAAPAWPQASGLATDEYGFIRVSPTLQSVSHPHIFACGDVAAYRDARPKSGVYAVRAGPVLAGNLRAICTGSALQHWTPQPRALYLISTGNRHALAMWGAWSWSGAWVWRWKDWLDRRFIRRFSAAPPQSV